MDPEEIDPEYEEQEQRKTITGTPLKKQIKAIADLDLKSSDIGRQDSDTDCHADPETSAGLLQATHQYSTTVISTAPGRQATSPVHVYDQGIAAGSRPTLFYPSDLISDLLHPSPPWPCFDEAESGGIGLKGAHNRQINLQSQFKLPNNLMTLNSLDTNQSLTGAALNDQLSPITYQRLIGSQGDAIEFHKQRRSNIRDSFSKLG